MNVTATEFKNQLGCFLDLASKEDIFISKNGKIVAKLCTPNKTCVDSAKRLFGVIPADFNVERAFSERAQKFTEQGRK